MFPFCVQTYVRFLCISSLTLLSGSLYSHRWSDNENTILQYRILIPTPVDQTSSSALLYKHQWITPSTLMTHIVCESKLHSVLRSSMHPSPVNHVAIRCVVVYHARDANAFSAGIKCWHCRLWIFLNNILSIFHYQTFTEWGRLDYEAGCGGGVWLTQVAISQWFIDQLVLRSERRKGMGFYSAFNSLGHITTR